MTGNTEYQLDPSNTGQGAQGPGRLVYQARELAKLSLEDLSAQIKLSRNTLDAIESDNFAQLNEPVYVRGYYRKLAKVLPVNESELLAAYARVAGHKAPPHPSKLILASGAELGSGRRVSFKLAVAIILLGLIIGALTFWGKSRVAPPKLTTSPVGATPAASSAMPVAATASAELGPTTTATELTAAETAAVAPAPASAPATSARAAAAAAASTSGQTGPLHMQFDASSWTEVTDASGKILLSGLVEAGSNQVLDGQPPFAVFLGNAPAVKLRFNGQPVDTLPFRRGDNTARITLP